jgi:hypothetical protein
MNADDAAKDLLATKAAAERYTAAAIDAARTLGYRDGLEVGRRAGKVEALRENARQLRSADGAAGHSPSGTASPTASAG